jgi:signal transduction histidine kinase
MTHVVEHANHLLHYDGILHWCFLIAVLGFITGFIWTMVRVLLPLKWLAHQAEAIMQGKLPMFDTPSRGIREIEQLRHSLHDMMLQVKAAHERELMYRTALTESQENERLRLAREIHDDTIQSLVLVAHHIERADQAFVTTHSQAPCHLQNARQQLVQTIDDLRKMIANLRPTLLEELGLAAAIESLCEQHSALQFCVNGEIYTLGLIQELALFRAAQEAISNAARHAQANQITATLTYAADSVILEVQDDGIGFQIPQHFQEFALRGHYGLLGIRERILHLGGKVDLNSDRATGTWITVMLPTAQNAFMSA